MNTATIIILSVMTLVSLVVIVWTVRTIWRELRGMGEGTAAEARRTEERKNEKIRKEIEQWRNGQ